MYELERSMTRGEWRQRRRISKSTYFKLKNLGLAPDEVIVPGTAIARITAEADRRWELRMAELANGEAARLEAERRRELATTAGKIAAQSPKHISKRQHRRARATV